MTQILILTALLAVMAEALTFSRSDMTGNNFAGDILTFKDRLYVPYGPDLISDPPQTDQPWTGFGYGLGATEHWAYDHKEKYIYSQSEAGGYVTIIDYNALPGVVTPYSMNVGGRNVDVRDIVVCSEEGLLFLTLTDRSKVLMYETVKRSSPGTPTLLSEIDAGNSPDAMKLSNDCSILAVANQNEGTSVLNQGAVTLVTNFRSASGPETKTVLLNTFTDEYLLGREVHMPLTRNAMIYWNAELGLGWDTPNGLIDQYNPALAFDPEFLAFNNDGTELYLNLQQNSAMVRISTATGTALSVDGYGLKDLTAGSGADIVKDGECKLVTNPCLFLARSPDGIATVEYEGVNYVLLAEEGSDFDLGDYEEKADSNDIFQGNGTFAYSNFTFDASFFAEGDSSAGCSANFNAECESNDLPWCSNFELTVGSSAVDYTDPTAPKMNRIVGFGGRGISIFRVPSNVQQQITMVWESSSEFEERTCADFPWANNALTDEEFAPICTDSNQDFECARWILVSNDDREGINERNDPLGDGCTFNNGSTGACPMGSTVDTKAQEDGLGVETVVVGIACDHLVALGCGENNAMCFLYDISDIESPVHLKTFNLSPSSRNRNPEQTYLDDLGDIDAETIQFIYPGQSPTGKSGFIFGGAISGTLSFWEFECASEETAQSGSGGGQSQELSDSDESLEGGAIAGIVIGSVVGFALLAVIALRAIGGNKKEIDTGKTGSSDHTETVDGLA